MRDRRRAGPGFFGRVVRDHGRGGHGRRSSGAPRAERRPAQENVGPGSPLPASHTMPRAARGSPPRPRQSDRSTKPPRRTPSRRGSSTRYSNERPPDRPTRSPRGRSGSPGAIAASFPRANTGRSPTRSSVSAIATGSGGGPSEITYSASALRSASVSTDGAAGIGVPGSPTSASGRSPRTCSRARSRRPGSCARTVELRRSLAVAGLPVAARAVLEEEGPRVLRRRRRPEKATDEERPARRGGIRRGALAAASAPKPTRSAAPGRDRSRYQTSESPFVMLIEPPPGSGQNTGSVSR